MPLIALALLSYASLVAITWPLVAIKLKRNLPVEPFLRTNLAAMHPPWIGACLLGPYPTALLNDRQAPWSTRSMPCIFALLPPTPGHGRATHLNVLLEVTVTDRWLPLVPAAYGTRVARPARITMSRIRQ